MAISNTLSQPDPAWTTIQNSGVLDNAPPLSTTPLDKLRAQQKAFGIKSHSTPTALTTRDTKIQVSDGTKIDLRIYTPDEKNESLPIVVVYHGGGWVMGDLDTEDGISFSRWIDVDGSVLSVFMCRWTSDCCQCRLSTVSFRYNTIVLTISAPEHPFPIPFNDCFDAYTWVPPPSEKHSLTLRP
jgi:acetyl esterase